MKRERTILAVMAAIFIAVLAAVAASCESTKIEIAEIDYRLKLSSETLHLRVGESGSVKAEYVILEDGYVVSSEDVSDDPLLILKSLREEIVETDGHRITAVAPGTAVVNLKYENANTSLRVAVSDPHEDNDNDDKNNQGTTEDEFSISLPERIDTTAFKDERLVIQYSYTSPDGQLRCYAGVRQGEIRDFDIVTDKESRTGQIEMTTSGILSTLKVVFKANEDTDSITFTLNIHPHEIKAEGTQQLDAVPEGETIYLKYTSTLPDADLQVKTSESWLTASLDYEAHKIVVRTEPNTVLDTRTAEITLSEVSERLSPVVWTLVQGYANEPVEGCVWFECPRLKTAALEQHDADGDREISFEEALATTELDAAGRGVTSVTGLEHFTALRTLDISGNDIPKETVIDLSSPHRSLIYINCDRDDVIDVRGCATIMEFAEPVPAVIHANEKQIIHAFGSEKIYHEYKYRSENFEGDEETFLLQQHTRGEGIAIEFYPIGFVDYDYDGGLVEILLRNQIEEFFQHEPMKSFRDCFIITYKKRVTVQRPREGVENISYKYCEHFDDDPGCNCETANVNRRKKLCYIILGNGRSLCLIDDINLYITEITADEAYAHEFGHQFGGLGDEYVEFIGKTHPDAGTDKETGRYNTSLSNDPEKVPWSRFLKHPKYKDKVGIYEGAERYEFGVYRPTENSMMNQHTQYPYFSAPCRYSLFKNIMSYSKLINFKDYNSIEEYNEAVWKAFIEYDVINDHLPI